MSWDEKVELSEITVGGGKGAEAEGGRLGVGGRGGDRCDEIGRDRHAASRTGGGIHFSLSRVPRIIFSNAELRRRLPDLLRNGETKAATERDFGFVPNSTVVPMAAPVIAEVSLGAGWIAMEKKGRYKIGDDAAGASATVRGDRALVRLADG